MLNLNTIFVQVTQHSSRTLIPVQLYN